MISLDATFRRQAVDLIRSWLDQNPQRTLVCFGSLAERSWFEFDSVATLPSKQSSMAERTPTTDKPTKMEKDVLLFKSISAGPIISGRPLIENVTLGIKEGTIVALRGDNGIGKSTLLRLVAGVRRPRKGEIYFQGKPLRKIRWAGIRDGVGYLPQEPELAGPSLLDIKDKPKDKHVLRFWEVFFDMEWFEDTGKYWTLSSGERTRATLLFQAAFRPRLWILDEPTSRIDAQEVTAFLKALRSIDSNASAIVVSHDSAFLNSTADMQYELTATGIHLFSTLSEQPPMAIVG